MIPLTATLRIDAAQNRGICLWIPLFLVWLLLAPLALLLSPLFCAACLLSRISLGNTLSAFWTTLCGLKGANLELETQNTAILIQIS